MYVENIGKKAFKIQEQLMTEKQLKQAKYKIRVGEWDATLMKEEKAN